MLAAVFVGVMAHELTHLALATEPQGICVGIIENERANFNVAVGTAYGVHNEVSRQEFLPTIVGGAASIVFAGVGSYCLAFWR